MSLRRAHPGRGARAWQGWGNRQLINAPPLRETEGFPGGAKEEPACQCRGHKRWGFDSWVGKIPWRRAWQPMPVFLPGESHGQRSLVGSVREVTKSRIRLSDWACTRALGNWSSSQSKWGKGSLGAPHSRWDEVTSAQWRFWYEHKWKSKGCTASPRPTQGPQDSYWF